MDWREIGDRVFVRRHTSFDLNVGLILGGDQCLVIDTRETLEAGRELADAVRQVTALPWTVVNTHSHFDHFFGNGAFTPCEIWALDRCLEVIDETGAEQLANFGSGQTAFEAPNRTFPPPAHSIDIGDREVELRFLGRGHTDNDIVITVDDVLFAGDLVEEGGPPMYGDAFPSDWPTTVTALMGLVRGPVVPGHGAVVDLDFVRNQHALLESVAHLNRDEAAAQVRAQFS